MTLSRVIILAAGQGSRLGGLTRNCHKALLPVGGEALLLRTVRQLRERGCTDITVVVGHLRESIERALGPSAGVRLVTNPGYASDVNIGSLICGLGAGLEPALVIEGDVALDDLAVDALADEAGAAHSSWFTRGFFQPHQLGGILFASPEGAVTDLRYVPKYDEEFSGYRKLLGILHVGALEMPRFQELIRTGAAESTAQYYMSPWARHLAELPCRARDLAHCRAATFNTPEDYRRCLELFADAPPAAFCHD